MGKQSAPPPPDYVGAANAQAGADQALATQQNYANRPNQNNPWGSVNWSTSQGTDPATGDPITNWQQDTTLNPTIQGALDDQLGLQADRTGLASGMLDRVGNEIGQAMDWDQFGEFTNLEYNPEQIRQQGSDAAYNESTRRMGPQFERDQSELEVKLRNQGLAPGDQAYDAEMSRLNERKTDAYAQARDRSTLAGRGEAAQLYQQQTGSANYANRIRQDRIREEMTQRGFSLNEINALLTGQQVNTPQFESYSTAGRGQAPQLLNATNMGYQGELDAFSLNQAGSQGLMSGLASIGSSYAMCDRRLKRHIKRIGDFMGYALYQFQYVWGTWAYGPMADELNPEAVSRHASGFYMVDLTKVVRRAR